MNATGDGLYDVAVAGLGPAGRALSSRCAAAGLRVLAVDPDPDAPWHQTLSLWADQLPPWLAESACGADVLAHTVHGPVLHCPDGSADRRADHRAVLDRDYAVIDTDRLRDALPLGSRVTVERASVDDPSTLLSRAHRVVDCRGAGGRDGRGPLQTAYGIVVSARHAAPALGGDPALFMDWRTDHDDDEVGPSFLYAIPLTHDRVLLEETCLAGAPAPAPADLAGRLRSRLLRRGVPADAIDDPLAVEEVHIPMLPPGRRFRDPRVEAFGTAGGHGHAATGYSIAATLGAVPAVVHALETGHPIPPPRSHQTSALNRTGLRALLRADERTLHRLFDAFSRVDGRRQRWFLDGTGPSYQMAAAMWQTWASMPARGKAGMLAAVRPARAGGRRSPRP